MDNFNYQEKLDKIITPKKDLVFKRIFGQKGNEEILKSFLEAILEIKIKSVNLDLNTEIVPEFYGKKASRVDVRAKLEDGTEVNVEIQVNKNEYSEKRCLYYWSKLYSSKLIKGENYDTLNKVICIWIVDGEIYKHTPKFVTKWRIENEKYNTKGHFEELEICVIELKKFRESDKIKENVRDFWLAFIDYQSKELVQMGCVNNEQIKKAQEELEKIKANKDLRDALLAMDIADHDYATAIDNAKKEGRATGIEEGRAEVVKSMIKANMSIEQIVAITKLSREEIEKIAKSEKLK